MGELILADTETELEALWSVTALIAAQYEQLRTAADWLAGRGVPPARADRYVRSMFAGIIAQAAATDNSLAELRAEAQTQGGLNEQALRTLEAAGYSPPFPVPSIRSPRALTRRMSAEPAGRHRTPSPVSRSSRRIC